MLHGTGLLAADFVVCSNESCHISICVLIRTEPVKIVSVFIVLLRIVFRDRSGKCYLLRNRDIAVFIPDGSTRPSQCLQNGSICFIGCGGNNHKMTYSVIRIYGLHIEILQPESAADLPHLFTRPPVKISIFRIAELIKAGLIDEVLHQGKSSLSSLISHPRSDLKTDAVKHGTADQHRCKQKEGKQPYNQFLQTYALCKEYTVMEKDRNRCNRIYDSNVRQISCQYQDHNGSD